jgi:hypothetical protein
MRAFFILVLLTLVSCSSHMGRVPTSTENPIILGNISLDHTLLSKYPSANEQVFYLELRSSERTLVDVDSKDVKLLYQGKIVKITLQRLGQGRYTLEPIKPLDDVSKGVFKVQKKTLKNTLISLKKPSRLSHIKLVSNENYLLRLELTLLDKKGKPLISGQVPDIILEGLGEISELESRGNGVWGFKVKYPEENQVFYLSVRAHGVLLERLLRHQHVEK